VKIAGEPQPLSFASFSQVMADFVRALAVLSFTKKPPPILYKWKRNERDETNENTECDRNQQLSWHKEHGLELRVFNESGYV